MGLAFDASADADNQGQGAPVFLGTIKAQVSEGDLAAERRLQLFTAGHEIGHLLNLSHR